MFLRALDTGLDRCFTGKARLAENQRQLDLMAQPPSETLVHEALEGINQCIAAMTPQDALPPASMARFCTAWHKALSATYRPDTGSGDLFMELAKAGYPPVWRKLCLAQAAQACLREGDFPQCKKLALQAASAPWIVPREQLDCLFAFATMGEGKFKESAVLLQKTASASNPYLSW